MLGLVTSPHSASHAEGPGSISMDDYERANENMKTDKQCESRARYTEGVPNCRVRGLYAIRVATSWATRLENSDELRTTRTVLAVSEVTVLVLSVTLTAELARKARENRVDWMGAALYDGTVSLNAMVTYEPYRNTVPLVATGVAVAQPRSTVMMTAATQIEAICACKLGSLLMDVLCIFTTIHVSIQ